MKMINWDEISQWSSEVPGWAPYVIASSFVALIIALLVCIVRGICCRRNKSNYEAINKDLDVEEKEFELGLSSDEDEFGVRAVDFDEDELKQIEMLESYGRKNAPTDVPNDVLFPLSPTAATTSQRTKKTLDDN